MKFWRSVVVKLWFTILLLVAFVLFYCLHHDHAIFTKLFASENEKRSESKS